MSETNATIESLIKKVKEELASKESIQFAHEKLKAEQEKIYHQKARLQKKKAISNKQPITNVALGQKVNWQKYQHEGIVLSLPDSSNRVLLQAGEVKMKVPINELYSVEQLEAKSISTSSIQVKANLSLLHSNEIDIRGFTVDEGIEAIDKFIDDALISGLEQIYIIHGKGTGKLRQGIYRFLDHHPRVKNKSYPEWSLGDTGMTIVNLK